MEAHASQLLAEFWSGGKPKSVALWADSSYGPLEQPEILNFAKELRFPLTSFTCSFGAGLTVKGDFHDPAGQPADVVFIEMGYNDDSSISVGEAVGRMQKRKWFTVLCESLMQVKFVVFIQQPAYKQTCPPKKKKKRPAPDWTRGAVVEGSKWTEQAMHLVNELGIHALCLQIPATELFEGMLVADASGAVWQAGGSSYLQGGVGFQEDGTYALWEDCWHPTAAGAEVHFRSLVKAFRRRFEKGAVPQIVLSAPQAEYQAKPQLYTPAGPGNRARSRSRERRPGW